MTFSNVAMLMTFGLPVLGGVAVFLWSEFQSRKPLPEHKPVNTDNSVKQGDSARSPLASSAEGASGVATPATSQGAVQAIANDHKSPWWTDATKVLVTQLVVLVLTPISVAMTVYITEATKAPKPRMEYVASSPLYPAVEPDRSFATQINGNPFLSLRFREELRNASLGTPNPTAAASWLDGRAWDPEYEDTYRAVTNQLIDSFPPTSTQDAENFVGQ
jgi:hypothetical protein